MTDIKYPEVVQAARSVGLEKKALAEALFLAIPPRRGRPVTGTQTIDEQLQDAADEILAETGERYAVETLDRYRKVAAWVAGNGVGADPINWADASWTAHVEAYGKGETFAQFSADPATKRRVRERNGASTGDVPAASRAINRQPDEAAKLVEGMTTEARVAVQRALEEAEVSPRTERLMRRMGSEREAAEDQANRGDAMGGDFEVRAMFFLGEMAKYEHFDGIRRVIAYAEGLLDLEKVEELTPEMFHE